jgi:hypothetical protein
MLLYPSIIVPNGEVTVYSWGSAYVLAPLIVGFIGLIVSIVFQRYYVKEPTVPFEVLANRTSAAGYVMTLIQ